MSAASAEPQALDEAAAVARRRATRKISQSKAEVGLDILKDNQKQLDEDAEEEWVKTKIHRNPGDRCHPEADGEEGDAVAQRHSIPRLGARRLDA